jgi:acetyl-CoA C-acetyltransferase
MRDAKTIWLASGLRSPFTRVDGGLAGRDELALSVPVLQAMAAQLRPGGRVDLAIWGAVIPNLAYSNLAREAWLEAKLDPSVPTMTNILACGSSISAAFEVAGLVGRGGMELGIAGGVESMSHVQVGLTPQLSDFIRRLTQARDWKRRMGVLETFNFGDVGLQIPKIQNRVSGKSMGEHCEEMAKTWEIDRQDQDQVALMSHRRATAAQDQGFFKDLLIAVDGVSADSFPRRDTSPEALAALAPAFDRSSGKGTLTAGNSSPLTDGAAGVWVASDAGLERLPPSLPRAKLIDFELAAVDIFTEGLLMAPAYAIPRLMVRQGMTYADVGLWELHEAFAAQVLCNLKALETPAFLRDKVGIQETLGTVPRERINPNGGSVAVGHPFGATGARILSQAVKEVAALTPGTRAIVSVCTDGGEGCVALLEAAAQ